jgi:hypothetical protein
MNPFYADLAASLPDGNALKEQIMSSMPPASSSASDAPYYPSPLAAPPPQAPPVVQMPEQVISAPALPPPVGIQASMPEPVSSVMAPMSVNSAAPPPVTPVAETAPTREQATFHSGGVSRAHEAPNRGPTQAALVNRSYDTLADTAGAVRESHKTQGLNEAMSASVREDDAASAEAIANDKRQKMLDEAADIQRDINGMTKSIARGPEATQLDTGNKALAALAVGLGAFGATFSGTGRNYAQEIIDKTIDRDVAQKRAAFEAKKTQLGAKQDAFGQLVQKYGMGGAEKMWSAAHAEKLMAQADQLAAAKGISQADAGYQQTIGELAARKDRDSAAAITFVQAAKGKDWVWDPDLRMHVPYDMYLSDAQEQRKILLRAQAEGKDQTQQEAAQIAKERAAQKLPQGEAIIKRAEEDLSKAPKISTSKAMMSDFITGNRFMPDALQNAYKSWLMDDNEAAREQSHTIAVNRYINDVTGAGGGPEEMKRIQEAAGTAKTDPEARRRFYADMKEFYQAQDQNIRAGASRGARARYDRANEEEKPARVPEKKR